MLRHILPNEVILQGTQLPKHARKEPNPIKVNPLPVCCRPSIWIDGFPNKPTSIKHVPMNPSQWLRTLPHIDHLALSQEGINPTMQKLRNVHKLAFFHWHGRLDFHYIRYYTMGTS